MKRLRVAAIATALGLLLGMETFAAGSQMGTIMVEQEVTTATVVDEATGEVLEDVTIVPEVSAPTRTVTEEDAKEALGTEETVAVHAFEVDLVLRDDRNREVQLQDGETIDITFSVPNVTPDSKVVVLHWNANGEEERLPFALGNGTVTATFTSFSPVAILVENLVTEQESHSPSYDIEAETEDGVILKGNFFSGSVKDEAKDALAELIGDAVHIHSAVMGVEFDGELNGKTKIKIPVNGITPADAVIIMQKDGDGWKAVSADAKDGYVEGKFDNLSPFVVFVDENGAAEQEQNTVQTGTPAVNAAAPAPAATASAASNAQVSPKTAETNMILYVVAATMAACAGMIVCGKKMRG